MLLREDKYIIYVALDRYTCSKIHFTYYNQYSLYETLLALETTVQ